jgi:hypothetical protein
VRAGQPVVNSITLKEGESDFCKAAIVRRSRGVVVMGVRPNRAGDTVERKVSICQRAYRCSPSMRVDPSDIIFDPNILAIATRSARSTTPYAINFIEATRIIKATVSGGQGERRRQQPVVFVPRQRYRPEAIHSGVPVSRRSRPAWTWGIVNARPARGVRGHSE